MAIKKLKANGHIVQADWGQTDSRQMDYIHNKPEIPEVPKTWDWDKISNKPENIATEEFVEWELSGKVDKISTAYRIYGTDGNGNQKSWPLSYNGYTSHIPIFNENAQLLVGSNPTNANAATPKEYVDTNLANKVNKAGGWTSGNYIAYKVYAAHSGGSEAMFGTAYMERIGQFTANPKALFDNNLAAYQSKTFLKTNQAAFDNSILSAFSDSEKGIGELLTGYPTTLGSATNKYYVDTNFIKSTADLQTITGSLTITGDLTIKGTTKTQEAQTQLIEENIIELNAGKTDNLTHLSGIAINKNNTSAYGIVYDPSSDAVKLGLGETNNGEFSFNSNEGTPIATREEYNKDWADDAIFVFDKETKKFKYSGKTLASFEEEIMTKMRAEMDTFVKDYIETYMSDIEIEHDDGTTEKVSKMIFANDYEEKQNGTELWIKED